MKPTVRLLILLLHFGSSASTAFGQTVGPSPLINSNIDVSRLNPSASSGESAVLLRTNTGDLIPLGDLLGPGVINELLQRAQEQRSVPRYTIDHLEVTGSVDRDVLTLAIELQIQIRPESEWVTVPFTPGDVYLTKVSNTSEAKDGQAVLTSSEQNGREWHLKGKGLHTVRMEFIGKTRTLSPGVSQITLNLPTATASRGVMAFTAPVALQKLPAGSVHVLTRDQQNDQGVRSAEFWGLGSTFGLTWSEIVAQVAQKPAIQVQNLMKLDLTTIPVNLLGRQVLTITGSPVSEVVVTFPEGFQLQEVDARNTRGDSVLKNFEITSTTGPVTAVIRLTSPLEGSLTLTCDLELTNRQFPQDIRISIPSIQDANVQLGDLDILFPTGLLVQQKDVKGAQRRRVTTETDLSVATTAFRMRSPESQIVLHVEETEAQFAVSPELTLQPEAQNVIATVLYPVNVLKGSLLDLAIEFPGYASNNWQIIPGSLRLINEKTNVPLSLQQSDSEVDVLNVTFPERQSGEFDVTFRAFAPLAAVRSGEIQLHCPEVRSRRGQPFVITTIESDEFTIQPISMGTGERLPRIPLATAVKPDLAERGFQSESWLHDDPTIPIRLELKPQAPSVRAEITLGMFPRENGLEVHETILFDIEHRDLTGLSLQVPDQLRPIVRISGQAEQLRATIESSNWSFRLPEARRGSLSVEISYLWTTPMETAQSLDHVYQLPVILPQGTEVRGVKAGTSTLSGLRVSSDAAWRPVYSEKFESAWETSQPVATVPIKWHGRHVETSSSSPDLILVRTQLLGGQVITSTLAVYESAPEFVTVETPEDLDVETILVGSQSLTSGEGFRDFMQTQQITDRRVVRWRIAAKSLQSTPQAPLIVEFRVRERLPPKQSLLLKTHFRRAMVAGESFAVPVVWSTGSQDEYQATSASSSFVSLTRRGITAFPGGNSLRTLTDRQVQAVLSPYSSDLQTIVTERVHDWMSLPGRQDVFFGSSDSGTLQLYLVPGVALLLVSAVICVLFFVVMSFFRQVSLAVPLLFLTCVGLVSWLLLSEWTLMLAPYAVTGVVFGIASIAFQRMMSDRRTPFASTPQRNELPTVFGFSGLLSNSVAERKDGAAASAVSPAEFSVGSAQ